jgi:hypothetical protein
MVSKMKKMGRLKTMRTLIKKNRKFGIRKLWQKFQILKRSLKCSISLKLSFHSSRSTANVMFGSLNQPVVLGDGASAYSKTSLRSST